MVLFLRGLFITIILWMLAVTGWASTQCGLFDVPRAVATHPWFIATLCDAYWGFITFSVWVCFKQTSALARAAWIIAIVLLGNIAMAAYCLDELFRIPRGAPVASIFNSRRSGMGGLGLALAAFGIAVTAAAWANR